MENVRVFLKSFGCSTNLADGEVLAGCLATAGYTLVDELECADIVIYNTCAVKGPTENRMLNLLKHVPKGKRLVVVGCLPLINFERLCREVDFDGVAGPAAGEKIVETVDGVLKGKRIVLLDRANKTIPSLSLPRIRLNPLVSIIPINYGCLGSCAYCCVVFARGSLRSYSIQEIVDRVKMDLASGAREIWLTSQDTACYGKDLGTNLAELVEAICKVEGKFQVRIGMMTPNLALDILDDLIQVFENEKVFKFFHLPVQSGDDQILAKMRRFYTVADFMKLVDALRMAFPKSTIATDVICGFPGEDKEAFKRTLKLIETVKPDIVNISKFFARPRTPAAVMQNAVPFPEIKKRSAVLKNLASKIALERNRDWIGWEGEVLIDEAGKVAGSWVGRNFAYKPVIIKSGKDLLGNFVHVKIDNAFSTYLESIPIN
ncbi:tRNA (N(6)-L-threonylcarbamoyladenosine(37)-C(2))-methylthiotransferase [Candidatus Bathyarchaeota archaeon]|nr:tRNA (N(6)-L-threonylcarbamoyladenosine(37)-C(2))-methylthiotransferase [Candidatus Bathyarchaeota archaeon]